MLKKTLLALFGVVAVSITSTMAQDVTRPNFTSQSTSMRVVAPHSSRANLIPAENFSGEVLDGRSSRNKVIIGKGSTGEDKLAMSPSYLKGKIKGKTPEIVFDAAFSNSQPTDPALAVGPDHVVVVFNTGYRFFDKDGTALTDQLSPDNIFSPGGCCDLTISYDNAAERWVMSYLYRNGNAEVAVSNTSDPVNTTWNVYTYEGISDYQKLSVWSDGYYMTANVNSASASTSNAIFVMDRDAMLAGEDNAQIIAFPLPGISTSGFYSPQAFNISDDNTPPAGNASIVYLQDDAFSGVSEDHIKVWTVNVDFDNPGDSTISDPQEISTTPFVGVFDGGSFSNLPQPNGGSTIDALQATIMNQAQFRQFSGYNSAVFNFVVDVADGSAKRAAIRWYELRQNAAGDPWTIHQEGTYTAPDGKHAWMGGIMMDGLGNISMGYTAMGGTDDKLVSSYYTGRYSGDPLGTMTIEETLIAEGSNNIPGIRYGDYGKIDVDPNNDKKMWFINEYMAAAGRANVVGVFQIAPNEPKDMGVVSINLSDAGIHSSTEEIKVTLFNFGLESASNFDITYTVNGGTPVTETYTGTLESSQTVEYIFAQTADLSIEGQTYTIEATVSFDGDAEPSNDSTTLEITNLFAKDVGVSAITAPQTGENLGSEDVTVTLQNFGAEDQTGFDVSYTVNGSAAVTETYAETLAAGTTADFTFGTQANLSQVGDYDFVATTSLAGDSDASNDSTSATIGHISCNEYINTDDNGLAIGPAAGTVTSVLTVDESIVVEDVNVRINLTHTWASDLDISLIAPDGTEVELTSDNGSSGDNYTDTVFDQEASMPITSGTAPFTGTFIPEGDLSSLNGITSQGDWTLSITDDAGGDGGELIDWSVTLCSSEVLSVDELLVENADFTVVNKGNDQYKITFNSKEITERLELDIYNLLGQRLLNYRLENENGTYSYDLDMSYAQSGIYIVKVGNGKAGLSKRIVIK